MFEQLRELRDRHGFEVAAIVSAPRGPLVDKLTAAGIPFHVCSFNVSIFKAPLAVTGMARLFARERFDVVQTHVFPSMMIGRLAAWIADVPCRFAMLAGPFHLTSYTGKWMERATSWMETGLIPSCEHSRDLLRNLGVPDSRITSVIYYGIDVDKFDPKKTAPAKLRESFGWSADTVLVGMVAIFYHKLGISRWIPKDLWETHLKGHDVLIRAAALVLKEFPNAKFLFVGAGFGPAGSEVVNEMRALVESLGLQDSILFTGYRTDVAQIYQDLDVSVQASRNENLGGSLETLAMARPIVATRVGGFPDAVIDGVTGLLVSPNDPEDLARGILRLLRDPISAKSFGRAGRSLVLDRFTLDETADRLALLYRGALRERATGFRPLVIASRSAVAVVVGAALGLRYFLLDSGILAAWDLGWRPWHVRSTVRYAALPLLRPIRRAIRMAFDA